MKTFGMVVMVLVAACGGDDDAGVCEEDGGAACFEMPTAPMVAHSSTGMAAPNLTCAKPAATPRTAAVTINGLYRQYTSTTPIPGITIEGFTDLSFASPIFTATSATDGTFSFTIPAGAPDLLHVRATGPGIFTSLGLYQRYDGSGMATFYGATQALTDTITTIVRTEQDATKGAAAIIVSDCDGNPIEHAIVTISTTSSTAAHVPGIHVFYGAPGALPLPVVRSERMDTNTNGAVAVLNVPTTGALHAQAWGFVSAADVSKGEGGLTLIAEWQITSGPNAAIAVPLRAGT